MSIPSEMPPQQPVTPSVPPKNKDNPDEVNGKAKRISTEIFFPTEDKKDPPISISLGRVTLGPRDGGVIESEEGPEFLERVGQGAFCEVYKGEYLGRAVAVKIPLNGPAKEMLEKEGEILKSLPPHLNVVECIEILQDEESRLCLVLDFCDGGSLSDNFQLKNDQKIDIVKGVAEGLHFLSKNGIVHRDLSLENVLIQGGGKIPKIADFGLAKTLPFGLKEGKESYPGGVGPLKYMAPESIKSDTYSEKTDVWSFAALVCAFLNNSEPYQSRNVLNAGFAVANGSLTPYDMIKDRGDLTTEFKALIENCCKINPDERPTFLEIIQTINPMKIFIK